jgi:hypothetical protein
VNLVVSIFQLSNLVMPIKLCMHHPCHSAQHLPICKPYATPTLQTKYLTLNMMNCGKPRQRNKYSSILYVCKFYLTYANSINQNSSTIQKNWDLLTCSINHHQRWKLNKYEKLMLVCSIKEGIVWAVLCEGVLNFHTIILFKLLISIYIIKQLLCLNWIFAPYIYLNY